MALIITGCTNNPVTTEREAVSVLHKQLKEPTAYPFVGKQFNLDTMPAVQPRKVAGPVRFPLNTNRVKMRPVRDGWVATSIKITPGEAGVPTAPRVVIPGQTVVAIPSVPRPMRPPGVKPEATHDVRYWDMEHGLHTYFAHAVHKDRRGYFWIGSRDDGLARFDGNSLVDYNKVIFKHAGGGVNHVAETETGALWLSMLRGIARLEGTNFRVYENHPLLAKGVRKTIVDRSGKAWLLISGGGVLRHEGGDEFTLFDETNGLATNLVRSIAADDLGNVWLISGNSLVRFDGKSFYHITPRGPQGKELNLQQVAIDERGEIWAALSSGLLRYNGKEFELYSWKGAIPDLGIIELKFGPHGEALWIATVDGLYSFNGEVMTRYGKEEGLSNNFISGIFVDEGGEIWASTSGGGLNKVAPHSFNYIFPRVSGGDLSIAKTIEHANGNIFVGTRTHGMFQFTGDEILQYGKYGLSYDGLVNMAADPEGNIWQGFNFDHALTKWNGKTSTRISAEHGLASGYCMDVISDGKGRIWGAFENGLSIIDGNTITTFDTSVDARWRMVVGLEQGANDDVWVATSKGLGLVRNDLVYWYEEAPLANRYHQEFIPGQGVWVQTLEGLGLLHQDKFYFVGSEHGLEENNIRNIESDPWGGLWAGTRFGLYRIQAKADGELTLPPRIEVFHLADGLRSENHTAKGITISKDSMLWVAHAGGVANLDLRYLEADTLPENLRVHLNGFTINESPLFFTADTILQLNGEGVPKGFAYNGVDPAANLPLELSVPYQANHFTFDFVAFDWSAPHHLHYQYRLSGHDEQWTTASTANSAIYRSLSHGTYTFEARAASFSGSWGKPLAYTFTIRPPWWLSWGAILAYGLAVSALLYGAYAAVLRRFRLRQAYEQEQAEAVRLRELDNFKSRLFTNLTHEFRTPLTVILGMARQLRGNPAEALPASQLIERNGESMLRLVNQLLDLSKLENNAFKLNLKQGDIIPFLRFLTNSFRSYADGENVMLQFFATEEHLIMDFDEEQIQQILSNLIANAVKFTPSQGEIRVKAFRSGTNLKISVSDTGIGIVPEEQDNIFNRFYQVDSTSTREGEGTGIGLAHTQELVHLMKGNIALESKPGEGSVFTVTLPITTEAPLGDVDFSAANRPAWLPTSKEVNFPTEQPAASNKEVPLLLVVEDNADVVTYLKSCLDSTYRVAVALNGRIGIDMALELIPDLIVSDVMMPEMDGFQLCDTLKNDERTSHVPIVLLTAKADVQSKLDGLKRGADAYLSKPFDREELLIRLDRLMERQRRMAAYFSTRNQEEVLDPTLVPEEILVEDAFVQKLRDIVGEHYQDEHFNLAQLCEQVNMSRSQLFRKLKALSNTSPSSFIRNHRLEAAKQLLLAGDLTIAEVGYAVGFKDPAHFSKTFREACGVSPSAYAETE
ncbi:MAG: ATP-binding protein [Lewinella sp.]